jgi:hypothetical protein
VEFQIRVHTGKSFILYAKKPEERDAWLRAIRYSIAASTEGNAPTQQSSSSTSSESASPAWALTDNDL